MADKVIKDLAELTDAQEATLDNLLPITLLLEDDNKVDLEFVARKYAEKAALEEALVKAGGSVVIYKGISRPGYFRFNTWDLEISF